RPPGSGRNGVDHRRAGDSSGDGRPSRDAAEGAGAFSAGQGARPQLLPNLARQAPLGHPTELPSGAVSVGLSSNALTILSPLRVTVISFRVKPVQNQVATHARIPRNDRDA